ncbi:recombinase family protein [Mesorhizobium loti]|uniref:recombinase family protein n=1 Tax=Rhizobium loti TaxID=381 RepID=UPI001F39008F|nr:recombinase family protein [Mesorhizobium loti]
MAALKAAGCEVIREEQKSGSTLEGRPQLNTILDFIHAGETLVVTRIDRLARSLRDLQVKTKGAHLFATEQPVDTSTAAGKAFFDMLGVFAEFETNLRRERQAEGIAAANKHGTYKGRPPKIDRNEIRQRLKQGHGPTQIARDLGVTRYYLSGEEGQMMKGRLITHLTPATCEEIQTRMLEVCQKSGAGLSPRQIAPRCCSTGSGSFCGCSSRRSTA